MYCFVLFCLLFVSFFTSLKTLHKTLVSRRFAFVALPVIILGSIASIFVLLVAAVAFFGTSGNKKDDPNSVESAPNQGIDLKSPKEPDLKPSQKQSTTANNIKKHKRTYIQDTLSTTRNYKPTIEQTQTNKRLKHIARKPKATAPRPTQPLLQPKPELPKPEPPKPQELQPNPEPQNPEQLQEPQLNPEPAQEQPPKLEPPKPELQPELQEQPQEPLQHQQPPSPPVQKFDPNIIEEVKDENGKVIIPRAIVSHLEDGPQETYNCDIILSYSNGTKALEGVIYESKVLHAKIYDATGNQIKEIRNRNKFTADPNDPNNPNKGKEIDAKNNVVYEGEYRENNYNGKGIYHKYDDYGDLQYTLKGTFKDGLFVEGTQTYTDNSVFEGKVYRTDKNVDIRNIDSIDIDADQVLKFGTLKKQNGDVKTIRQSCVFQQEEGNPNKGRLIDKYEDLFFEGEFYEERDDQLPIMKKGTIFQNNKKFNLEEEYNIEKKTYKGKLYDKDGKLIFEGTVDTELNPIQGIKYKNNGKKESEGDYYSNGQLKKGKLYNDNNEVLEDNVNYIEDGSRIQIIAPPPDNEQLQEDEIYGKVKDKKEVYQKGVFKDGKFVRGEMIIKQPNETTYFKGDFSKEINKEAAFEGIITKHFDNNDEDVVSEGIFTWYESSGLLTYPEKALKKKGDKTLVCLNGCYYTKISLNGQPVEIKNLEQLNNFCEDNNIYDCECYHVSGMDNCDFYKQQLVNGKAYGKRLVYKKEFRLTEFSKKAHQDIERSLTTNWPNFTEEDLVAEANCFQGSEYGEVKEYKNRKLTKHYYHNCLLKNRIKQKFFFKDGSYSVVYNKKDFFNIENTTKVKEYNKNEQLVRSIEIDENNNAIIRNKNGRTIFTGKYDWMQKQKHGSNCVEYNSKGETIFKGSYDYQGFRHQSEEDFECIEYKLNKDGTYNEDKILYRGKYNNGQRDGYFFNPEPKPFFNLFHSYKQKKLIKNVASKKILNLDFFKTIEEYKT